MTFEDWRSVRWVKRDQVCHLCWNKIPRGSPGSSTGTRGVKAWILFNARLLDAITRAVILGPPLWECLKCHSERTRAELAQEAMREGGSPGAGSTGA